MDIFKDIFGLSLNRKCKYCDKINKSPTEKERTWQCSNCKIIQIKQELVK